MAREEKGSPMGSVNSGGGGSEGSSLAARRARLRGALEKVDPVAAPVQTLDEPAETEQATGGSSKSTSTTTAGYRGNYAQPNSDPAVHENAPAVPPKTITPVAVHAAQPSPAQSPSAGPGTSPLPAVPDAAMEVLGSIDGALSACATNLAALQRLAVEQTEVLKSLSSTLQNQTLFEIGLNLNSLTESLSAALEPMRAFGELVPAMDQLVSSLEGRAPEAFTGGRVTPEVLVTGLADQLQSGLIDPWTFKCAYMAIYPSEHPADLLHRLVELLGTQRLPGDLFRAAYEAVQGAEAPPAMPQRPAGAPATTGGAIPPAPAPAPGPPSEEIRSKIEELERANVELRGRQEQRERELQTLLQQKEHELSNAQGMLNARYEEFNTRYEQVSGALSQQGEQYRTLLESKDMELVEKESELNLLRAQMEELRSQTEDMVKDLQRQLADMKTVRQEPPAQAPAPAPAQAAKAQPPGSSFFDNAPNAARGTFEQGKPPYEQAQPSSGSLPPHPAAQLAAQQSSSQPMPAQQGSSQPMAAYGGGGTQSNMAVQPPPPGQSPAPRPAAPQQPAPTTPFAPGAGSYGSGVRAQVFEVIVRQALAGAPWREICSGPMQVNNISPEEVEAEVKRRQALLNK
jgi:hypothetical protein